MRPTILLTAAFALAVAGQQIVARHPPHLIVPVNKLHPDQNYGTQNSADVEHSVPTNPLQFILDLAQPSQTYTMFSFDATATFANSCKIAFEMNTNPVLWAPYKLWGLAPYRFNISHIDPTMNKDQDTWNNRPAVKEWVATVEVGQGGVKSVTTTDVPCVKGDVDQYIAYPADPERDFGFTWYRTYMRWFNSKYSDADQ